jgi:outer membrane protein TolC
MRSDRMIAAQRCSDSERQRLAAEKNYDEVSQRFGQGAATAQDVVEAEELFTSAEAAVSVARYELCRQWALLQFAAGCDDDGTGMIAFGKGNE